MEVCKFYTIDEHTSVPDVLIISTIVWNSLNAQEQQWLNKAMKASITYQRKIWAEAEEKALAAAKKAGVTVIYPDKSPFMAKLDGMLEKFKAEPETYELIQQIKAVKAPGE